MSWEYVVVIEIPGQEPQQPSRLGFRTSLAILVAMVAGAVFFGAVQSNSPLPDSGDNPLVDADHPGIAEVEWTRIDGPWPGDSPPDQPIAAVVATDDRIILGSRRDWRAAILESPDDGMTWSETFLHDRIGSHIVGGTSTPSEAFLYGRGAEGAIIWRSTDAELDWSVMVLDDGGADESVVSHLWVGDELLAVGQKKVDERIRSFVSLLEDDATWTTSDLPVTDDAEVIANSAAMRGETIVVGGIIARGVQGGLRDDPFPDGTSLKPVVWVSTDRGATWEQHFLRPTGDLKGVVTDVFVADGEFRAAGYVSNATEDWLNYTDTDVVLWSSSDGSAWTGQTTSTPGNDFVKFVLGTAEGWQLFGGTSMHVEVGDDVERLTELKVWTMKRGAWESPMRVALDIDNFAFAEVAPTADGWLMAVSVAEYGVGWDPILFAGTPRR